MCLAAIIDWHNRRLIGWELSGTLETAPVLKAARSAIEKHGTPATIDSGQGSQFTSGEYAALIRGMGSARAWMARRGG
ncbi:MAG: hypothetical protein FWG10_09390 [Eubacteriaceae bacterium]|nr:hypothetical protein [Eubacteriaceae bacterium]